MSVLECAKLSFTAPMDEKRETIIERRGGAGIG